MITNIPDSASLTKSSIKLYFSAWKLLVDSITDFETTYPEGAHQESHESFDDWRDERNLYLDRCQDDYRMAVNTIQQSNEIALKAKIASISPFLLLTALEKNLKQTGLDADFSDFVTIDAIYLPNVVNLVCPSKVSSQFKKIYTDLRRLRNKITHIGHAEVLNADKLLRWMIELYLELWPERHWLQDKLECSSTTRTGFFHDYKHWTTEAAIFNSLKFDFDHIKGEHFKKLFKVKRSSLKFKCPVCYPNGCISSGYPENAETAFKDNDGSLKCLMCQEKYQLLKKSCNDADCSSRTLTMNHGDEWWCAVCGSEQ
jgi:hypothetical protein